MTYKTYSILITIIALLLTCCSFSYSLGQSPSLVLTEAQNNKWLDSVSAAPFVTQLQMIKERLLADTGVFVQESYPHGVTIKDSLGSRVNGAGKPMLLIENVYLRIDNHTEPEKITELARLLNPQNIETLSLMKGADRKTAAIYGSGAWFGVIHMKLRDKKDVQRFWG